MQDGHNGIRQFSLIFDEVTMHTEICQKFCFMVGAEDLFIFLVKLFWGNWSIGLHFNNIFIIILQQNSKQFFEMFRKYMPCEESSKISLQNSNRSPIPYRNTVNGPSTQNYADLRDKRYSVGLRDDLCHILKTIDNKKPNKTHFRNFSDVACPNASKGRQLNETELPKGYEERIKSLQQKFNRTQERLQNIENKIDKFNSTKCIEQTLLTNLVKQNDKKFHDFSSMITELKFKLDKFNFNGSNSHKLENFNTNKLNVNENQNEQKLQERLHNFESNFEEMKKQFFTKIRQMNQKLKSVTVFKDYEQAVNPQNHFFRTNRKYSGNYVSFLYEQFIKKNEQAGQNQNKENQKHGNLGQCINQITYYIDPEGFLLDENCHYLVNSKMKQIKLSEKQLKMLKKLKIIPS